MSAVDPFEQLQRAKDTLREGLTLLESAAAGEADSEDAGLRAAWEKMLSGLSDGSQLAEQRGLVAQGDLAAYDGELREVMRLNAVLMAAVKEEQGRVVDRLRRVRGSRREMAYYSTVDGEGERCDISG